MVKFENYEVSAEERRLETIKYQRRMELRSEFLKHQQNAYAHVKGEGGYLFDPALQRFHSMRVSFTEHFKPNFKTWRLGMIMVVFPIIFGAELLRWDKTRVEKQYRAGQVSYKDRRCKFF